MSIIILNHAEVEELLPMAECLGVMEQALTALAQGHAHQPLRMVIRPPGVEELMIVMPAHVGGKRPAYGLKTLCLFPQNVARGKDAHQGSVMLFSGETGELQALMNASAITAIRTAAVSGVATKLLARPEAGDLALIGSGVQARTHLQAMACVRPIRRARVTSRNIEHARAFAGEMQARYPFPIEPVESVQGALRGADLIVLATTAREPIIKREWVAPGAHLNVVGASQPTAREVDTATMAAARLFVDRRESTFNEAGDYLLAVRDGVIGPEHIRAELGELLTGAKTGRAAPDEITLFKSLGLAIEDLASAEHVYRQAQARGIGTRAEF